MRPLIPSLALAGVFLLPALPLRAATQLLAATHQSASGDVADPGARARLRVSWENPPDAGSWSYVFLGFTAPEILVSTTGPITPTSFSHALPAEILSFEGMNVYEGACSAVIGGLQPATAYHVTVRAHARFGHFTGIYDVAGFLPETSVRATTLQDALAPAAISDLGLQAPPDQASVELAFTTPGDDLGDPELKVTSYLAILSTAEFDDAAARGMDPQPLAGRPGNPETGGRASLDSLQPGTTYWVALVSADEAGNRSLPSNIVTFRTTGTAPVQIAEDGNDPQCGLSGTAAATPLLLAALAAFGRRRIRPA